MDFRVVSMIIWAVVFVGPPLVVALGAPLYYADAREKMGGKGKLHTGWVLILLALGLIAWAGLLRMVYMPAMSFDLGDPAVYNYGDVNGVLSLWSAASSWLRDHPSTAAAMLSFPLIVAALIMVFARYLGVSSRSKEIQANKEYHFYNFHG